MRCPKMAMLVLSAVHGWHMDSASCESVDYLRDIRPILSQNCYACHGPDEESREADLRLDLLESAMQANGSLNPVIAPGEPDKSELIRRTTTDDADEIMPPRDEGKSLTREQIDLLHRWIEQGASWRQHWAFEPPQRPDVPEEFRASPIDYFVQAMLLKNDLKPSPRAEKEILLRRVTFDLTGLPPTLEEIDAFLADDSTEAYERVVDRLLGSPHYGEHMARFWLDAARYGDTHGLHLDNYREMWPYRDWVIKAFNRNLPFDRFVIEQLAGDLLPEPTLDQRIATGFCRAHVSTNEGGSIEQEVFTRNVVDRVGTFGTVFLGLTLECSSCHDHKFDPISQKEFYQLFAFFNSLDGPAMDGNVKDPAPVVSVPSREQASAVRMLQDHIEKLRVQRAACVASRNDSFEPWLQNVADQAHRGRRVADLHVSEDLIVHCSFDEESGPQVVNHAQPNRAGNLVGPVERVVGYQGSGLKFRKGNHLNLGNIGKFNDDDSFSFSLWVKPSTGRNSVLLGKTDASQLHRGYELSLLDGRVTAQISRRQPGYVIKVTTTESVVPSHEWRHVTVTYDGSKRASGVTIYVDGESQPVTVWSDALQFKGGIRSNQPLLVGNRDQGRGFDGGHVDDVRVYAKCLNDAESRAIFLESQLDFLEETPQEHWSEPQRELLAHFFLMNHDAEFIRCTEELRQALVQLQREELSIPTTLVYRELRTPREAHVLLRGQYDKQGESVQRMTPALLPPMPSDLPRNRLGLARWLVNGENPLFGRVTVNRFWQQLFGRGLVETSEDFGNQGAWPSHPDLLDWLAVEFRTSGWDIKRLMKSIVMSDTYRQSSRATPGLLRRDPDNKYLARGPRYRLDAEMLRDQALAVSGLLVPKVGGPSVKPPQPAGLWMAVGFSSSNTVEFVADVEPSKIHRRSLYVFYKRTSPPPAMNTFDAPSRESSCVRRERTNTPLQSLLLMNDPQYVAAAQALAKRVMSAELENDEQRARRMYRLCTARYPRAETVEELVNFFRAQLARYQDDAPAAKALLSVLSEYHEADQAPDISNMAAWTLVANLILNLDEVVTKN